MNIQDYQVGEKVMVKITDIRSDKHAEVWREGIVTDKGYIHPSIGERFPPYPKFKVKYTHTYYRVIEEIYNGIVYIGCKGEFYDKENESLFFYDSTIKKFN